MLNKKKYIYDMYPYNKHILYRLKYRYDFERSGELTLQGEIYELIPFRDLHEQGSKLNFQRNR